eukprot:11375809-Prorocentrum_lima.AAC.1
MAVLTEFRSRLLQGSVLLGWEALFDLAPEARIIYSADLIYTYATDFHAFVDQVVVISRNRVAIILK